MMTMISFVENISYPGLLFNAPGTKVSGGNLAHLHAKLVIGDFHEICSVFF